MIDFTAHKHPLLAVPCPDCGAPAGAWCKRPSGHRAWGDVHASRKVAADLAWYEQRAGWIIRTEEGWACVEPETAEEMAAWEAERRFVESGGAGQPKPEVPRQLALNL